MPAHTTAQRAPSGVLLWAMQGKATHNGSLAGPLSYPWGVAHCMHGAPQSQGCRRGVACPKMVRPNLAGLGCGGGSSVGC